MPLIVIHKHESICNHGKLIYDQNGTTISSQLITTPSSTSDALAAIIFLKDNDALLMDSDSIENVLHDDRSIDFFFDDFINNDFYQVVTDIDYFLS